MAELTKEQQKELFRQVNGALENVNVKEITEESDVNTFEELPDGYYLCELTAQEVAFNKAGTTPQVKFTFEVKEGYTLEPNAKNPMVNDVKPILDAKGKPIDFMKRKSKIWTYHALAPQEKLTRTIAVLKKFEDPENLLLIDNENFKHQQILDDEAFEDAEILLDALEALVGSMIWVQNDVSEKDDGTVSTWKNVITWLRAKKLGLPVSMK